MRDGDRVNDAATDPETLPSDVQARWDALADAARQLASATDDAEGRAAWGAMTQAGRGLDHQQILNAMHVPKDAGEHTEALRGMLVRIPDGWGRWISCSRGWYPLLVELDEELQTVLPNYLINQVKEKYGGLRYYWEPGEDLHDPADPGGEAASADLERRIELAKQLVHTAEARAAVTCELCGAAGEMQRRTSSPFPWYKTLCPACAQREGYIPTRESHAQ